MDTQTGRGVRRRRQELIDADDNEEEEREQVTQQGPLKATSTIKQQNPHPSLILPHYHPTSTSTTL